MSAYLPPQAATADYGAASAGAPVRQLSPAEPADTDRRRNAREKLLLYILDHHRRRQVDAARGLRGSGAS